MPDPTRPSREAREAAARLWLRLPDYHRLDRRAEVDIARALDDFAEKWREEAAMWKRSAESQHGSVQEVTQERDALRERVGELELAAEAHETCKASWRDCLPNQNETMLGPDIARHWKARAERAEKALDEIEDIATDPNVNAGWRMYLGIAREARRARGER